MLILERQQRLLDILKQRGSASLEMLSAELDVSVSTVRRDLDRLAERGLIERTHGGAVLLDTSPTTHSGQATAFAGRMADNVEAKRAIGAAAARLIEPNMTILMDAGSTVVYAAQQITVRPIQIATTSLAIAQHFANDEQVEITVVGGKLYPRTSAMVGPLARQALRDLYADICFLSLAALDENAGYNLNTELTRIELAMMDQAERSVLLMDASKFGRRSLVRVAELDRFDEIITDAGVGDQWPASLGSRLTVATR
ncbi:DeoR/GlpR family DNA-binding transcription regulator [Mucisphaera calidilacus]|uniref:HTH-type transcriptional repressor GlcR n=1 Tax=Mucisphaera calidilacus TaxID=2527982 RepID=A0A518BYG3_9BACT|nr:DeoR/GlpR family DNA-binding transcription regulator [Mucisphaera calidilacus]QDU72006.1 HTH-type transcriptional repressor GlcR [Mucisphaera calidilacus]